MGGRGEIEKRMSGLFWNSIWPQMKVWESYMEKEGNNQEKINTEKILLRYMLNAISAGIDSDVEIAVPEEMYILGKGANVTTGSIVSVTILKLAHILLF